MSYDFMFRENKIYLDDDARRWKVLSIYPPSERLSSTVMLVRSIRTFFPHRPPQYTLALPNTAYPPSADLLSPRTTIYSETELYRKVSPSTPSSSSRLLTPPPFPPIRNP